MNHPAPLLPRHKAILGFTGMAATIIGTVILLPLLCLLIYRDEASMIWGFLCPGAFLVLAGCFLSKKFLKQKEVDISYREGWGVLALSWTIAVVAGAIPFWMTLDFSLTQAVFESTSGWTTTGLSVTDVSKAPRIVLLYRSLLQWFGGAGFAVMMLSALTGPKGTAFSEVIGRREQLAPNIKRSARLVSLLYSGYTLLGIFLLHMAGMNWFDAVNHACAAVSTGGFSTQPLSIGYWDSAPIEAVTMVLMLLGGTSFVTVYLALQAKWSHLMRNGELRLAGALLVFLVPLLIYFVTSDRYPMFGKALRVAAFEVVSALTTTGFSTGDYTCWPDMGWLLLIVPMLVGGGTGCTAGGMKQHRIYILYRGLLWEFRRKIMPQTVVSDPDVWQGNERRFITEQELAQTGLFVFLYFVVFVIGVLVLSGFGFSLKESVFEFASSIGTVGLSVGVTKATSPPGVLWMETAGMILGRLEFFTLVVGGIRIAADVKSVIARKTGSM